MAGGTTSALAAAAVAGQSAPTPAASTQGYPSSFLQHQALQGLHSPQQAQALGQAHAMQAAAYMQAMQMNAAAVAAAGNRGQGMPWGYNPYLFPPYGNPYGGYQQQPGMDYAAQAAAAAAAQGAFGATAGASQAQLEAVQAKLAAAHLQAVQATQGALGGGAGNLGQYGAGAGSAKAQQKGHTTPTASPLLRPAPGGMPPGKKAPPPLEAAAAASEVGMLKPKDGDAGKEEGEDEAGCSQS